MGVRVSAMAIAIMLSLLMAGCNTESILSDGPGECLVGEVSPCQEDR